MIEGEGKHVRLIAGSLFGQASPVRTFSEMFYADVALEAWPQQKCHCSEHEDACVYVAEGEILIAGDRFNRLASSSPRRRNHTDGVTPSRLLFLGGEPMDGPCHIWWNFVPHRAKKSSRRKEDWAQKRLGRARRRTDFIPLPA